MTNYAHSGEPYRQSEAGSAVLWLLAGIAIGAVAALLLAPSTGRELRSAFGRGFRSTLLALNRGNATASPARFKCHSFSPSTAYRNVTLLRDSQMYPGFSRHTQLIGNMSFC